MKQLLSPAPRHVRQTGFVFAIILSAAFSGWAGQAPSPALAEVLERTGKQVARFLDQFGQITCTELVTQEKLHQNGKLEYREQTAFDLLTMVNITGTDLTLDESRLPQQQTQDKNQPEPPKNSAMLVTNGFSTLFLIFHPFYQQSFQFSRLDDATESGRSLMRVQFRHIQGTRSPIALLLRGRTYPLDLQGIAWIDPESGVIAKMEAELESNLDDLGLRVFHSEVQYAPAKLKETDLWLPASAIIDVQTPRQHWRNIHQFTNYRRFSVSTEEKTAAPGIKTP